MTSARHAAVMASLMPDGRASAPGLPANGTRRCATSASALRMRPCSKSRNRTPVPVTRLLSGHSPTGLNARYDAERACSTARVTDSVTASGVDTPQESANSAGSSVSTSGGTVSSPGSASSSPRPAPPILRSSAWKSASLLAVLAWIRPRERAQDSSAVSAARASEARSLSSRVGVRPRSSSTRIRRSASCASSSGHTRSSGGSAVNSW